MDFKIFPKAVLTGTIFFWFFSITISALYYKYVTQNENIVLSICTLLLFIAATITGFLSKKDGWINGLLVGIQWSLVPLLIILIMWLIWYLNGAEEENMTLLNLFRAIIIPVSLATFLGAVIGISGGKLGEIINSKNNN